LVVPGVDVTPDTAGRCDESDRFHLGSPEDLDQQLVGTIGYVTVPITANRPGEVLLPVRGGTEGFSAYCDEPVAKNTRVVVVEARSGRSVFVTPCG
jgi:membrane protein implicated in regulation of membrane protease activity